MTPADKQSCDPQKPGGAFPFVSPVQLGMTCKLHETGLISSLAYRKCVCVGTCLQTIFKIIFLIFQLLPTYSMIFVSGIQHRLANTF